MPHIVPEDRFVSIKLQPDEWLQSRNEEGGASIHLGSLKSVDRPRHAEKLWREYFQSFSLYFPPEQSDSVETLRSLAKQPGVDWDVTYARHNGQFIGGTHSRLITTHNSAMIGCFFEFIWIDPAYRASKLCEHFFDRIENFRRKQGVEFLMAEIKTWPADCSTSEEVDKQLIRARRWAERLESRGYLAFDAPWIQPPQTEDQMPMLDLLCLTSGLYRAGDTIPWADYLQLWKQAYPLGEGTRYAAEMEHFCRAINDIKVIRPTADRNFSGNPSLANDYMALSAYE
jgi:hypothetical protein